MATTNLGRVRFRLRGDYNPAADPLYSLLDLVSDGGGSFVYINDTPSNEPTSSTTHWQQIASVGGQDLVDAAVAARDAAQGYKDAAAASAAQLAAGVASPAGTYANLAVLNADILNVDTTRIYVTEDDGKWCFYDTGTSLYKSGAVYQTLVDTTLAITGRAADAKVTGDALTRLYSSGEVSKPFDEAASIVFSDIAPETPINVIAKITSTQTGAGDPSPANVRPITGVSSIEFTLDNDVDTPAVYAASASEALQGFGIYHDRFDIANRQAVRYTKYMLFDGSESWKLNGTTAGGHIYQLTLTDSYNPASGDMVVRCACDRFKPMALGNYPGSVALNSTWLSESRVLILVDDASGLTDLATFKAWLSSNNTQFVYALAATTTEPITSVPVIALRGTNTLSADTSVLLSGTYIIKPQEYLERAADGNKIHGKNVFHGGYYTTAGVLTTAEGLSFAKIPVVPKQVLFLYGDLTDLPGLGACFDASGTFVAHTQTAITFANAGRTAYVFIAPAGVYEYRPTLKTASWMDYLLVDTMHSLDENYTPDTRLARLDDDCFYTNLAKHSHSVQGFYISSATWLLGPGADLCLLPASIVEGYDNLVIENIRKPADVDMGACGYFIDEDWALVSTPPCYGLTSLTVAVPATAKYFIPIVYSTTIADETYALYRVRTNPQKRVNKSAIYPSMIDIFSGKVWAALGDSITYLNLWQPHLVSEFGLTHINCGLGSSSLGDDAGQGRPAFWEDIRLGLGAYSASLTATSDGRTYSTVIPNNPDIVTIWGGANDQAYGGGIGTDAEFDLAIGSKNKATYKGAYSYIIETLLTWKPTLRIILITQYGFVSAAESKGALSEFAEATIDVGKYYGLPVIDLFGSCGINKLTEASYLSDGIHINAAGAKRVAERVIAEFKRLTLM